MLSTEMLTGFNIGIATLAVLLVLFCLFAYRWMVALAQYCREAVEFVQAQNKNAVSLRRIAEVEATLTELLDSYDALLRSHKKLRARIGMRIGRQEKANGVDSDSKEPPTDEATRAAYKSRLREKLRKEGRL